MENKSSKLPIWDKKQKVIQYLHVFKSISAKKISEISGLEFDEIQGIINRELNSGKIIGEFKNGIFHRDLEISRKKKELLLEYINKNNKINLEEASKVARLSLRQTSNLIDEYLNGNIIKGKWDSERNFFINFAVESISKELDIKRDYDYVGGDVRFKVVVRNITKMPITDITVMLNVGGQYIVKEPSKKVEALMPGETRGVDFMLTPITCGISKIMGIVSYYDPFDELHSITIRPKEIRIKCPLVIPADATNSEIIEWQKTLLKGYSTIEYKNLSPSQVFDIICDQISSLDLKLISKNDQELISTYAGITKISNSKLIIVAQIIKNKIKIATWTASLKEATGFIAYLKNLIHIALNASQLKVGIEKIGGKIIKLFEISQRLFTLYNLCIKQESVDEILILFKEIKIKLIKIINDKKIIMDIEQWETEISRKYDGTEIIDQNIRNNILYDIIIWLTELEKIIKTNIDNYHESFKDDIEAINENNNKLQELKNRIELTQKSYINLIIKYIMIIYKISGIVVYSQAFGGIDLDEDLISGFLTAISSFGSEISKKDTDMKSITYQDFEIEIVDGINIKVALILNGKKIGIIKNLLKEFINIFETKNKDKIANWKGDVSVFDDTNQLINEYFNFENNK
ncbi:MAG: hypothetical protein ACTSPY_06040 [Candidatus Helarchaeota archaeon]